MSTDTPMKQSPAGNSPGCLRSARRKMQARLARFFSSEDGPTAVEYAVMLSLIVVVCLSTVKTLGSNAKTTFSSVSSSLSTSGS